MTITLTPDSREQFARLIRDHSEAAVAHGEAEEVLADIEDHLLASEGNLILFMVAKVNEAYASGLCGTQIGVLSLPTLETRCDTCDGSGVIESLAWREWCERNPGLSHAAKDLANDLVPNEPEKTACGECGGVGWKATPAGEQIIALVTRRLHQHTRDQYRHIGKQRGAGLNSHVEPTS
ncbi:hypothetical protein LCGC14_2606680 [marine sediment metagenome]|uniref:Uncharacterized protein n=1 Tax=marine sediment metagenome TaxID=412755 RepID=A0A0F9CZV9_9ZZZZ